METENRLPLPQEENSSMPEESQPAEALETQDASVPAAEDAEAEEELVETGGNLKGRIEAMLFVAGEAVEVKELCKALNETPGQIEKALREIRDEYDFAQRGFMLRRFGTHVQLTTRALYSGDVVHLLQPVQKQSLSQALMETLAIIAYRQNVTRAEIEEIRGVKCDYSLQVLTARGLIEEKDRRDTIGHPIEYGTTDAFLQHFGITSLDDLPPMPEKADTTETEGTLVP